MLGESHSREWKLLIKGLQRDAIKGHPLCLRYIDNIVTAD